MAVAPASLSDDSRHSLLSKAHAVSQASLEAFARSDGAARLPRSDFGPYTVREVEARSALTRMPSPYDCWSLNPYMGCSHACAYCYVPDVAHVERRRWGTYVVVKRNLATVLARELRAKARDDVFLSSATDPYQPAEARHRITRACLEVLARADWPLSVLTRSPLVCRDTDLLARFGRVKVGLSVPTLDDDARRVLEPAAPPIAGRLKALRRLADAGFETYANLAPMYPLTGGVTPAAVAAAFKEARVGTVVAGSWRYAAGVAPVVAGHVAGTAYEPLGRSVWDAFQQATQLAALQDAFAAEGVAFRVMGARRPERDPDRQGGPRGPYETVRAPRHNDQIRRAESPSR